SAPIKDAWGAEFGFRERAKGEANPYGGAFFGAYNVVSAGPDGKFGTDDDVALNPSEDRWMLIQVWWLASDSRSAKQPNLGRRGALLQQNWRLNRFAGKGGGDMFFRDGAPPPGAGFGGGGLGAGGPMPKL